MFAWLVEAGWVNHNPFRLMRDKSRRLNNQTPRIERYLESGLWAWLWQWLNRPLAMEEGSRAHFEQARRRFIFGFAYLLAPRISEMADARMGISSAAKDAGGGMWWVRAARWHAFRYPMICLIVCASGVKRWLA
ncbi:hypothetical protein HORIV_36270 [Vreelandella olivaria]|uniref:Uncharacterized protein n=1 Tax=Vreelandella olivaria TaxID=390919 RepID=A0ABM7GKV7_9GAMM|nr:hypothetical protein HORIV_36270 [Halomonas olivaria]